MKKCISVIIPVYNTALWMLEECIESIYNQTYKYYEILLIDDGSKKECADYIDSLSLKYSRKGTDVKVFHKTNEGVSSARNFGIENAHYEYIAFIDADDCIHKNYLEFLIQAATDTKCNVARCKNSHDKRILDEEYQYRSTEKKAYVSGYVTSAIYSKSVIGTYRFSAKYYYCEDILFDTEVMLEMDTCALVDMELYFYRKNPESATAAIDSDRYYNGLLSISAAVDKLQKKSNREHDLCNLQKHRELCRLKYLVAISLKEKKYAVCVIQKHRKIYCDNCQKINNVLDKKMKMATILFKMPANIVRVILRAVARYYM